MLVLSRPDMTFTVDWALNNNYLSNVGLKKTGDLCRGAQLEVGRNKVTKNVTVHEKTRSIGHFCLRT